MKRICFKRPVRASKNLHTLKTRLTATFFVIVMIPILIIYPFIQKYFVKGVMIGSIKG